MNKLYYSLGLMSGTSGDGVDASIIQSDGDNHYKVLLDKYFKYSDEIYNKIHYLKDKINTPKDLKILSKQTKSLEKKITMFHADAVNKIIKKFKKDIDFIGFHGQTILHNAKKKISIQLGDGKLLSKLTKKTVVYNFRKNDLKQGGQGAPLTPIFHKILAKKFKFSSVSFLNMGGIANQTNLDKHHHISASDIGPGMCLIDRWVRLKSKNQYDKNGKIGRSGKINKFVLAEGLSKINFKKNNNIKNISYDTKDFNLEFVKGLSFRDGVATLTEYTVKILINSLPFLQDKKIIIILCGGGRKNKFLIERIRKHNFVLKLIDDFGIDGDFIESQAFAYIAIRSYLKLPISFPATTGVKKSCTGGLIFKPKL